MIDILQFLFELTDMFGKTQTKKHKYRNEGYGIIFDVLKFDLTH